MNPQERHPHGLKKITIHSFFVQTTAIQYKHLVVLTLILLAGDTKIVKPFKSRKCTYQ